MTTPLKRKLETVEPVQWAVDFLQEVIDFYQEGDVSTNYMFKFLQHKTRELREDYYYLSRNIPFQLGIAYSHGLTGARLMVIRILLSIFPPYNSSLPVEVPEEKQRIANLQEALFFLRSLYLKDEGDSLFWQAGVNFSLNLLRGKGFLPFHFKQYGKPMLAVAPPYREEVNACYLQLPNLIILYSSDEPSPEKRSYLFLHEIGHLLWEKYMSGGSFHPRYKFLLSKLNKLNLSPLLQPAEQGSKELFANLFAISMLKDTAAGDYLFSDYFHLKGEVFDQFKEFFNPSVLLPCSPAKR